ncbi:MAG: hypothetical protein DMF56_14335 [Acidobacteria bacterium]|nr:MAG: hypothetical protein DMF56_14335 [Acidobacteriota bacterium]
MRPRLSPILIAIAVLAVLAAYVFFASNGTMAFRRVAWDQKFERPAEGYYASLAEGFRRGQLSMAHEADPRLKAAFDPYRADVREQYHAPYLWDASFYRGRYYLYFTALPVVLFYLPFRVIAGAYPLDALAGVFFSAWAFIMATLTLRRAFLGRNLHLPLPLWILVIGLGNVIAFTLSFVRTYEVAILAATAMSATWAYALLRFIETQSAKHAMWMGLWLALAVVARPNLIVLTLIVPFTIGLRNRRAWVAFIIPAILVAVLAGTYNYRRFGNVRQLGWTYQLTGQPMRNYRACSLCNVAEGLRAVNHAANYIGLPPKIRTRFPFVEATLPQVDASISLPGNEPVVGILAVNPLVIAGNVLALLLLPAWRTLDTTARAGLRLLAGAWLVLLSLSACWYVVARYSLDFMLLMCIASAIAIECGLAQLAAHGISIRALRIGIVALAVGSIVIATLLGFEGPFGAFHGMR